MAGSNAPGPVASLPMLSGSRWRVRGLDQSIASVDPDTLAAEFVALKETAARRSLAGKPYFVRHTGVVPAARVSSRLEEHYAIALVNLGRRWPCPKGGWFRLLDYQVPLKARQADARIGKVDLLGVTDQGRLMIVELKVARPDGGRSDAPPAALMEALRYAAIVEADLEAIASEAEGRFGTKIERLPPIAQLLAPEAWWRRWLDLPPAGDWGAAFARLAEVVGARTGVVVECMALDDENLTYGPDGRTPRLDHAPALYPVLPGQRPPIGEALSLRPPDGDARDGYREEILRTLWAYAERHHEGELDGGPRQGRPPVLEPEPAGRNILVPPDGSLAEEIRGSIAARHSATGISPACAAPRPWPRACSGRSALPAAWTSWRASRPSVAGRRFSRAAGAGRSTSSTRWRRWESRARPASTCC